MYGNALHCHTFCRNFFWVEMHKYKNIFFDLDDTLYDFSTASRESFLEAYELLGYERFFDSFEQFMHIYEPRNKQLWQLYGEGKITKEELNKIRYSYPLEVVGVYDSSIAERFCKEVLGRIPTKSRLVEGAIDVLEYLSPRYNLYILSNGFKELQSHKMVTSGIMRYFRKLVLSDDIGVNKPRPELFRYALATTGSLLEESLMIGDMFETDIVGAANVGMHQMFFNAKAVNVLPFEPTYVIHKLEEIKGIL